jgi:S-adenosylmethionine:tRNA ribosyltransferase-isomerase
MAASPDPEDLRLSSYDYDLPESAIAQEPVTPRHDARMLVVPPRGEPASAARHRRVWDLCEELRPGDLLVVNDTRVLQARLQVRRPGGGGGELLLLEPRGAGVWLCLARPARRMRPGDRLMLEAAGRPPIALTVLGEDRPSGGRLVQFPPGSEDAAAIETLLAGYGEVPLPPYIHRHDPSDQERYQTRYARHPGAVAAPTAGLHLSDDLLERLQERGVTLARITLHVGLGTFRPIDREDLRGLSLHGERVEVTREAVAAVADCRARGGRVCAVGTTSVRALEGVAGACGGELQPFRGAVDLVIQPGHRFRIVQGLLTNFHLPRSSLLLLVSALIGRRPLLQLYGKAIAAGYRFYSYGDAMWIPPEATLP